jgi:hypothetical protein
MNNQFSQNFGAANVRLIFNYNKHRIKMIFTEILTINFQIVQIFFS